MRTRQDLEAVESRELAPYAMASVRSRGRVHDEPEHGYRTAYQRDRDRIVHSAAFRRMEYKTQVFVNTEGDYYRTRLTHTLEVAQVARTVARTLGLNTDLTEALALVHDVGHAPFGHAGEQALAECMADHGGFEHNAQGLRIVTLLETRYPTFPGLNLSYETREGMAKHGNHRSLSLSPEFHPEEGPLLESVVADLSDRLAYNHHDLDDGLTSGLLTEDQVRAVPHVDAAFAAVDAAHAGIPFRVRVNQAVLGLINLAVTDLLQETTRRIAEMGIDSHEAVRAATGPVVGFSPAGAARAEALHGFLFDAFYSHWQVARSQETAKRFLATVFRYYVETPRALPPPVRDRAERDGLERAVCDHVASFTDRELHDDYRRILLPDSGPRLGPWVQI